MPQKNSICEQCGQPFTSIRSSQRYCSLACAGRAKSHGPRSCAICGTEFVPKKRKILNCSPACSKEAWRRKHLGKPVEERFWPLVLKTDSCWLWQGSVNNKGYGTIFRGYQLGKVYTHRLSWELANGPIPEGLEILHDCPGGDNPLCCNPAHLRVGTHLENMADMRNKGRNQIGSQRPNAKLTEDQAREILVLLREPDPNYAAIGKQYGVADATIASIAKGRSWAHVRDR